MSATVVSRDPARRWSPSRAVRATQTDRSALGPRSAARWRPMPRLAPVTTTTSIVEQTHARRIDASDRSAARGGGQLPGVARALPVRRRRAPRRPLEGLAPATAAPSEDSDAGARPPWRYRGRCRPWPPRASASVQENRRSGGDERGGGALRREVTRSSGASGLIEPAEHARCRCEISFHLRSLTPSMCGSNAHGENRIIWVWAVPAGGFRWFEIQVSDEIRVNEADRRGRAWTRSRRSGRSDGLLAAEEATRVQVGFEVFDRPAGRLAQPGDEVVELLLMVATPTLQGRRRCRLPRSGAVRRNRVWRGRPPGCATATTPTAGPSARPKQVTWTGTPRRSMVSMTAKGADNVPSPLSTNNVTARPLTRPASSAGHTPGRPPRR